MNYNVRIAVKNSTGNELAKVFNFTVTSDLKMVDIFLILRALVKENYSVHLGPGCRRHRGTAISFEVLCKTLKELRFYETKSVSKEVTSDAWEYVTSLEFPCDVYVRSFHSEWGGTFFEITSDEKLIKMSFDGIRTHLEKYNIDLFKSKTEGLWYTHRWIELTDLHHSILIRKKNIVHEWVNKTEKVEL
jgi:hypothetical protein